jgi:hypothetical protein
MLAARPRPRSPRRALLAALLAPLALALGCASATPAPGTPRPVCPPDGRTALCSGEVSCFTDRSGCEVCSCAHTANPPSFSTGLMQR